MGVTNVNLWKWIFGEYEGQSAEAARRAGEEAAMRHAAQQAPETPPPPPPPKKRSTEAEVAWLRMLLGPPGGPYPWEQAKMEHADPKVSPKDPAENEGPKAGDTSAARYANEHFQRLAESLGITPQHVFMFGSLRARYKLISLALEDAFEAGQQSVFDMKAEPLTATLEATEPPPRYSLRYASKDREFEATFGSYEEMKDWVEAKGEFFESDRDNSEK